MAAREIFEVLTNMLPGSPQAMALWAYTTWQSVMRGWSRSPAEYIERAVGLAEKAIERGDPDGFGRVVMASVRLLERRHDEALAMSESAESVRVSCPIAKAVHSNVLHFSGHHVRAIDIIKRAVKHARIYPPWMGVLLAASYRDNGQIAPSSSIADECLRLDPDNLDANVVRCTVHAIAGEADEARMVAQEILRIDPSFRIAAYLETQPYKNRETLERIAFALRDAGLPG